MNRIKPHVMNIFSVNLLTQFYHSKREKNQLCVKNVLSAFEEFISIFKGYTKKWMDHGFEDLLRVLYRKTTHTGPLLLL